MRTNSWIYHYYMVQSRLQYGLAYGGHPAGLAAYYPHMLGGPPPPPPPHGQAQAFANPYDPSSAAAAAHHHHSLHSAYLQAAHSPLGIGGPYGGYGYNPPAGSKHLAAADAPPPAGVAGAHHPAISVAVESKEGLNGPLDFSKAHGWQQQQQPPAGGGGRSSRQRE